MKKSIQLTIFCFVISLIPFSNSSVTKQAIAAPLEASATSTTDGDTQKAPESQISLPFPETEEPVTITLDPNYPEAKETRHIFVKDAAMVFRDPPKRYGFSFGGYYLDPDTKTPLAQGQKAEQDMTIYAKWDEWSDEVKGYMDLYLDEAAQAKYIIAREPAYEKKGFNKYVETYFPLFLTVEAGGKALDSNTVAMVKKLQDSRENLKQLADPESVIRYIWKDNNMPMADTVEFSKGGYGSWDVENYMPFLVPYILKDQSKVKGNIICVAGGGYFLRANYEEAYPSARYFNSIGYNAFVLQRRVAPYAPLDSSLDLQRSVRYLRYKAKNLGIAKKDIILSVGFSGGGGTILGTVKNYYGDVLPTVTYTNYVPDDVDKLNSDMNAIMLIYSARGKIITKNPNFPATFAASGSDDPMFNTGMDEFFESARGYNKNVEMHLFAGAPHGFGMGTLVGEGPMPASLGGDPDKIWLPGYRGADQWGPLAEIWLDVTLGYESRTYNER